MGTKQNPGRFDCYGKALPDEPLFVLLGRDPAAAETIRFWAATRLRALKAEKNLFNMDDPTVDEEASKIAESLNIACTMERYRENLEKKSESATPSA
jgi:hypothetical protein